jgi:hypothetical protein
MIKLENGAPQLYLIIIALINNISQCIRNWIKKHTVAKWNHYLAMQEYVELA